jgi:predicted NBD/HSP70 family sugar kinase
MVRGEELRAEARGRPFADLVLEYVWHQRQVSRAEVARALGLSRSTVSEIVATLLDRGLVREGPNGPSRGGRRPVLLEFQDDAASIFGVELGASHVSVALTDLRGRVMQWRNRDHPVRSDPEGTIALILQMMEACLAAGERAYPPLLGIGVAVASPVDSSEPDRLPRVVLPAWHGHSGMEQIRAHFGVPVVLDNDANLGALAERWWGAGRGLDDFTYIKVATGVGAGFVIRGQIYPGARNFAGEIGHLTVDSAGKPCVCGNRGCLATIVGTSAILDRVRELVPHYQESMLARAEPAIGIFIDAALADDPLAQRIVVEVATVLGSAVASVLNLLNPSAVVIGGGLARLGDRFLNPLRSAIVTRTLVRSAGMTRIVASELGPRAVALGAATIVLASALADPGWFGTEAAA